MIDVVCGVITNAAGEYLACQRPSDKHLGDLWEFPGGKVDPGETPEAALARELREELEINVLVGRALSPVIWDYDGKVIRLFPFHCKILGGSLRPVEHQALQWCSATTWNDLAWAPADLPILREIFA